MRPEINVILYKVSPASQ